MRPADLVWAITNEAGITSRDIGAIQIADTFSLVEVPEAVADDVVTAMRGRNTGPERHMPDSQSFDRSRVSR